MWLRMMLIVKEDAGTDGELTEQILVVLGKDGTGFLSICFISGSRKTVNKVFERKR